ncbi:MULTISPECIES: HAD family phosphatase [unclassified Saccharopolyspora]|uniref:HAD family hydrolase n=1 Tax=unclassified Saccharopolyspora TaxID=2646250 RepID=UPI001CD68F4B|nr:MULTISPECIES: HAD family phosphatase [unclassified Saccharopolyspora]MCA1190177.1 HAD family phosphatase [Saccharopolyspora sp. 6T]MCA1195001.1 HAD family phosphatase [Saccharopolyspora sp. 6V]MCA1229927.1 HAD family phosphatase [Saccharopolyspora sp. 6M]MCA1282580.1 HAD family phosphatase [Saccharopolyspora sp. 7B]
MTPAAVLFDLDGVLVDSEQLWDRIRRDVVAAHGGRWTDDATRAMQGMSTPEWARYLVDDLGAQLTADDAAERVISEMARVYAADAPVLPGAADTLRRVAERFPTAIASSAPPRIIQAFLDSTGLTVGATLSSEQVGAGKPAPDVYLEAARLLGTSAADCAAVEDSSNGLRAATASGATVFAVPNAHFPPAEDALAGAHRVLGDITELPAALDELG